MTPYRNSNDAPECNARAPRPWWLYSPLAGGLSGLVALGVHDMLKLLFALWLVSILGMVWGLFAVASDSYPFLRARGKVVLTFSGALMVIASLSSVLL